MDEEQVPAPQVPSQPEQPLPAGGLVNVRDPDTLQIGSVPAAQLEDALSQGYTQPAPDEVHAYINEQKYGTLPEQLKTIGENAASTATFGLAPRGKHALERAEANPVSKMVGQGLGLVVPGLLTAGESVVPGLGELSAGNLISRAGEAAAEATGLATGETAGAISKIGSGAVKAAVENMLFQSTDEVAKRISNDPKTVETAMIDIGLSGLLGGGIGAGLGTVSPLWNATSGSKVGQILKALKDRAGGIDGVIPDAMQEAIQISGIPMAPEIRAGLSDNPYIQQMFKTLEQSDTTASGPELQESFKNYKKLASDSLITSLGKTPEEVGSLGDLSKYESGKQIGSTLADELSAQVDPLAKKFEEIKAKVGDHPLDDGIHARMATDIGSLVQKEGWYTSPSSDVMREVNRALKEIPELKTIKDLSRYQTQLGNNTYDFTNPQLSRAGQLMKGILRDAESDLIVQNLAEEGPHLVAEYAQARDAWRSASELKDQLDSRLHVGGGSSPTSFIKSLKEMSSENAERIVQRLSGKNDAEILSVLQQRFPQTAEALRSFHLNDLLKAAASKAGPDQTISSRALLTSIEKMSPELRKFVVPEPAMPQIKAVGMMLDHFEKMPHNFSNTARTLDKLSQYIPGSAIAMATMLTGHNPAMALVLGPLTKFLGKDVPDAVRLALLKFIGSGEQIESEGFKNMVDFIHHAMKGENLIGRGTKAVFKAGQEVLPQSMMPSEKETKKLNSTLEKLQLDPSPLVETGGKTAHYLPEHGQAMGQTAANAVNYLNSLRPSTKQVSPLDKKIEPTKAEKAQYERVLTVAEQPLTVLSHIKNGTILPQDIATLRALYPALYDRLTVKLTEHMMDHLGKDGSIPYKTRMGLSLFLGQPLDSSMTPASMMSAQATFQQNVSPTQNESPQVRAKHSMAGIGKTAGEEMTPLQARQSARTKN